MATKPPDLSASIWNRGSWSSRISESPDKMIQNIVEENDDQLLIRNHLLFSEQFDYRGIRWKFSHSERRWRLAAGFLPTFSTVLVFRAE